MIEGVDWTNAVTFEEMVIQYFETRKTDSREFKALVAYFGKEKLATIWEKWKKDQL